MAPLVTLNEAAAITRISRRSLGRYRASGELPEVRFGQRILFHREDLAALIERRRSDSSPYDR